MGIFSALFGRKNKRKNAIEKICKVLDGFMVASLLLVDKNDLDEKPEKQMKVMAYNFGAIDYLCQSNDLDQAETLATTVIFLTNHYGMSGEEAGKTARLMMELSKQPEGLAFMMEGGNTMKRWLGEGDKNAPLRLFELLRDD